MFFKEFRMSVSESVRGRYKTRTPQSGPILEPLLNPLMDPTHHHVFFFDKQIVDKYM